MAVTSGILALDVGSARIGVALTNLVARLPHALTTLSNDENFFANLQQIIQEHQVETIVVGLPRGLDGQSTSQTKYVEDFISSLQAQVAVPIHTQDEAVTSKQAEAELEARGKAYTKGDIDSLSATYILEDYLREGA